MRILLTIAVVAIIVWLAQPLLVGNTTLEILVYVGSFLVIFITAFLWDWIADSWRKQRDAFRMKVWSFLHCQISMFGCVEKGIIFQPQISQISADKSIKHLSNLRHMRFDKLSTLCAISQSPSFNLTCHSLQTTMGMLGTFVNKAGEIIKQ